jgi:hypothetical protein
VGEGYLGIVEHVLFPDLANSTPEQRGSDCE